MLNRIKVTGDRVAPATAFAIVALALCLDVVIRHDPISVDFRTHRAAARVGVHDGWSRIYDQGLVAIEQGRPDPALIA